MSSLSSLTVKNRDVYKALNDLQPQYPKGVPSLVLAAHLELNDVPILAAIRDALRNLPAGESLQPACVNELKQLVKPLEKRQQAGVLSTQLKKIKSCGTKSGQPIDRDVVEAIEAELESLIKQNVEKSVSKLRDRLLVLWQQGDQNPETVSRAPYRIVAQQSHLDDVDVRILRTLHAMMARPACLKGLRPLEKRNFSMAQNCIRRLLATGHATDDAGHPIELLQCRPRSCVKDSCLRRKLECINELSHEIEQIFGLFYAPHAGVSGIADDYVMQSWARPYATDVILFLNGGRNAILQALNPFYVRAGMKRHPLIKDHGFPQSWVPAEAIPAGPPTPNRETLAQLYAQLLPIGEKHRLDGSSGIE